MAFKRSLGPIGLMFTAVSGMLGSAWLFGPYYVSQAAGPAAVAAWVLGGLAMIIIAMTFAELACMFPVSGGNARFIHLSHGTLASFIFSWIMWIGYTAVAPIETLAILQYAAGSVPWLMTMQSGVAVLTPAGYGVAAAVLLLMCIINFSSIKWLSIYNSFVVWIKVLVPVCVAIILMMTSFHRENFTQTPGGFLPYGIDGVAQAISVAGVIFSYAGYAPAIALAGEAKNPQKTVPIVLVGAISLCIVVYTTLQIAFIGVHEPSHLMQGWHNLHFTKDVSPFVGITESFGLTGLAKTVFITAMIIPAGTAIIFIATSARVSYAMSQNGYFPSSMQYLSKHGVPVVAVLFNFVVGMILFFPSPGWQGMVGFLVAAFVLCYAIGPISLMALRTSIPAQDRPFKLPCHIAWSGLALFFANLIVYWTGWETSYHLGIAIFIGIVSFLCLRLMHKELAKKPLDFTHSIWAFFYLTAMALTSYLGQHGGGLKRIPAGWDIAWLAVLTIVTLYWAHAARLPESAVKSHIKNLEGL